MPDAGTVTIDGQDAALAMLRRLRELNWHRLHRRKNTALVAAAIGSLQAMPEGERLRFVAVIADWLASDVVGGGYELDDYEQWVRRNDAKRHAREAKRCDPGFQKFLSTVQGTSAPLAT